MKSEIKFIGLQIKSYRKFQKLAKALEIIEEECGIKNVKITLDNVFICERIDWNRKMSEMGKLLYLIISK